MNIHEVFMRIVDEFWVFDPKKKREKSENVFVCDVAD